MRANRIFKRIHSSEADRAYCFLLDGALFVASTRNGYLRKARAQSQKAG
jgi:hypothetical protein